MSTLRTDLTARLDSRRGDVRENLLCSRQFHFDAGRDRVILIHGIRNNETRAREAYEDFKQQAARIDASLPGRMYAMVWPGDALNPTPSYFRNLEDHADESAELLAEELLAAIDRNSTKRYTLVAHSLGCRVAVQTMAHIYRVHPALGRRFRVILMAAAIPSELLASGSDQREALQTICVSVPLSSNADVILRGVFPPGRLVSGGLKAVGLNSEPRGAHWLAVPRFTEGFGHSEYWQDQYKAINRLLARLLNIPIEELLPEHALVQPRLAEAGPLPENRLPSL